MIWAKLIFVTPRVKTCWRPLFYRYSLVMGSIIIEHSGQSQVPLLIWGGVQGNWFIHWILFPPRSLVLLLWSHLQFAITSVVDRIFFSDLNCVQRNFSNKDYRYPYAPLNRFFTSCEGVHYSWRLGLGFLIVPFNETLEYFHFVFLFYCQQFPCLGNLNAGWQLADSHLCDVIGFCWPENPFRHLLFMAHVF